MDTATWVAAWATVGLGLATVGLAVGTFLMSKRTKDAVDEAKVEGKRTAELVAATKEQAELTRQLAEAAKRQADTSVGHAQSADRQATVAVETLQHLRDERNLEWRPILHLTFGSLGGATSVDVHNLGRGPALNILVLLYAVDGDGRAQVKSGWITGCGAGDTVMVQPTDTPPDPFYGGHGTYREDTWGMGQRYQIFCQDQAGRSYRFTPPDPMPELAEGDEEPWARDYRGRLTLNLVDRLSSWWREQSPPG